MKESDECILQNEFYLFKGFSLSLILVIYESSSKAFIEMTKYFLKTGYYLTKRIRRRFFRKVNCFGL